MARSNGVAHRPGNGCALVTVQERMKNGLSSLVRGEYVQYWCLAADELYRSTALHDTVHVQRFSLQLSCTPHVNCAEHSVYPGSSKGCRE